jgi:hypothetical protein
VPDYCDQQVHTTFQPFWTGHCCSLQIQTIHLHLLQTCLLPSLPPSPSMLHGRFVARNSPMYFWMFADIPINQTSLTSFFIMSKEVQFSVSVNTHHPLLDDIDRRFIAHYDKATHRHGYGRNLILPTLIFQCGRAFTSSCKNTGPCLTTKVY